MAIRLLNKQCVIYEIPKTGTTFIANALTSLGIKWRRDDPLFDVCPRHSPWWCYPEANKKICIVRHPLDWYMSFYNYHREMNYHLNIYGFVEGRWYAHRRLFQNIQPFDAWINWVISNEPSFYSRLVDAFCGPFGFHAMSHVFKTESLNVDLTEFLKSLGCDITLGDINQIEVANKSKQLERNRWEPKTKQKILHLERSMINRFYE